MIDKEVVSKMDDGREKKLMEILAEKGKPYEKKHDGYAVKVEEDITITYTDYNNTELTMKVPKGSYIMVSEDSSYPKVVTEKEFIDSNEFCDEEEKEEKHEKSKNSPKIGLEAMEGNY